MRIDKNIKLAKYTTFHIGGKAEFFTVIKSVDDLKKALDFAKRKSLKIFTLGGGSNILLPDEGVRGLTIKMEVGGIKINRGIIYAGAGESWDNVVAAAVNKGLSGIENLSLIPGTVGGAVYQNIGAYGTELKDMLESVEILDTKTSKISILPNKACTFGYRQSIFQKKNGQKYIILGAKIKLSKKFTPNINYSDLVKYFGNRRVTLKEARKAVIAIRRKKLVYPTKKIGTAGSFFKNPVISNSFYVRLIKKYPNIKGRENNEGIKLYAGQLVELAGWKGKRIGNVGTSQKHSMVLVSYKDGQAKDIVKLARAIQKSVKEKFGVSLEPEVKIMP